VSVDRLRAQPQRSGDLALVFPTDQPRKICCSAGSGHRRYRGELVLVQQVDDARAIVGSSTDLPAPGGPDRIREVGPADSLRR